MQGLCNFLAVSLQGDVLVLKTFVLDQISQTTLGGVVLVGGF